MKIGTIFNLKRNKTGNSIVIKTALCLFIVLSVFAGYSQTWQSSIVKFGTNGKLTYVADANQNRVIDFSAAGYKNSNETIPTLTNIIVTLSPIAGDNTAAINAAIQSAASISPDANGLKGVILLQPGNYEIQGTILLNISGVVLRGSGSGVSGTVLTGTGDIPHQRTMLVAGGGINGGWNRSGSKVNITSSFVAVGSAQFTVASTAGFSVGDGIVIYHPSSAAWITAVEGGATATDPAWTAGSIDIQMNRIITAISGDTITIESPVTNHLDLSLSQCYIYKIDKSTTQNKIGVENLRIDIQNWTNLLVDENHAWEALEMYDLEDSWAKNVVTLHFGQAGFKIGTAARITIDSCQALDPCAQLIGGQRDNFQVDAWSSNILLTHCYGTKARHCYEVNGKSTASLIVFHRCTSVDPTNPSEGHYKWSTGILFDCFRDSGTLPDFSHALGLYNRGDYGTSHGWGSAHSVGWNCDLRRSSGSAGIFLCQKPPTAQNFAIGGFGQMNVGAPFPQPAGYVEGWNNNAAALTPESLFEQQLMDRSSAVLSYTFTGNGFWNTPSNWTNNAIPPNQLPALNSIIIDPIAGGQCILNVPQHILPGAKLIVMPGKNLLVQGSLMIQ